MKKLFLCVLMLVTMFLCSSASAFTITALDDWGFKPDNTIMTLDEMLLKGMTLNNSTSDNPDVQGSNGTFELFSTFYVSGFQEGGTDALTDGLGINGEKYELTVVMTGKGNYISNTFNTPPSANTFTFTEATLDFYIDFYNDTNTSIYGTEDNSDSDIIYGANDGTRIAGFDLYVGTGNMDFTTPATPADGVTNVVFESNFLETGYWFDPDNNDMSSYPENTRLVFGITDSNNNIKTPTTAQINEYTGKTGLIYEPGSDFNFFASNDGSFVPGIVVIPEPATLFLFGSGLLGLAGIVRRRKY